MSLADAGHNAGAYGFADPSPSLTTTVTDDPPEMTPAFRSERSREGLRLFHEVLSPRPETPTEQPSTPFGQFASGRGYYEGNPFDLN